MTSYYRAIIIFIIFTMLHFSLFTLSAATARADHLDAPTHHISMEFDLATSSLKANSRIEVPAGTPLHLDLSNLNIIQVIVNGHQQETAPDSHYLDIPALTLDQEIIIAYSTEIAPGTTAYSMISETGITLSDQWYPVADREMLFKLTAMIPADFEAVSEAEEIIAFQVNDRKQVTFLFPHPLFAINFVAGPYIITAEKFADDKELFAYFFAEDQHLADAYLQKAKHYLERYEKMLGPYPYKRFSIVENRLPTGFAMPAFTLLGQSVVRLPFIIDTSLGHEVLHAWFGNGVRMSSNEGNWVEGLTTYLADQAFAEDEGRGAEYRKEQLIKYQSYVRPDMDLTLRSFRNVGHEQNTGRPARAVGYNKSAMFFHMLRNKVGPEVFTHALQDFYKRLKHKSGGWSDLQTSFENISGLALDDFFTQWLDRNDIPELFIENLQVKNSGGYPVLHFDIMQRIDPHYTLELPVIIKTNTEEIRKTLAVADSRTSFEIPLAALPHTIVIDPDYDIMRILSPRELPATWSRYLGAENRIAILPSEDDRTLYKSLLAEVEADGARILLQDEVSDKDLVDNSLLFLGAESRISRSLFALPDHPAGGFTLDARKNPLNPDAVAVLVSAINEEQVEKAAAKLRHYGKYSYLSFKDGRIRDKQIGETELGLQEQVVNLPSGIAVNTARDFDDIITQLHDYRVIYVGEGHTSYEDHLLQLEIIRALYEHDPNLAIGMEMFTKETQQVIDRYMGGELDEKSFLKESHYFKMWRFDYRLYRDIINFARHNHLQLLGLNLEKHIVSQVFKSGGPNSLPDEEISSLPQNRKLDIPGYRERIETAFMMHGSQEQEGDFSGFLQAQALWDETMAETIAEYLEKHPDTRMVVIAGRGHVDKINAIPPRVARRLPVSQAVVVNSVGAKTESESADFIFFSSPASLSPFPLLGVMLDDTEDEEGVLVTALNPQGQAKEAGIKEKDIILAIDSEPVNDMEDVKIAMLYKDESDAVMVRVRRKQFLMGNRIMEIEVNLKKSQARPQHMGKN